MPRPGHLTPPRTPFLGPRPVATLNARPPKSVRALSFIAVSEKPQAFSNTPRKPTLLLPSLAVLSRALLPANYLFSAPRAHADRPSYRQRKIRQLFGRARYRKPKRLPSVLPALRLA